MRYTNYISYLRLLTTYVMLHTEIHITLEITHYIHEVVMNYELSELHMSYINLHADYQNTYRIHADYVTVKRFRTFSEP